MSTCNVKLPDEIMNKLSEFDKRTEEITEKSLKAGAEITYKRADSNLGVALASFALSDSESRSTGQLRGALGISPVKPSDDGYNIKVGFNEPRDSDYDQLKEKRYKHNPLKAKVSYTMSRREKMNSEYRPMNRYSYYETTNAMIANIIEHGKKGQAAKPFMKPAEDATKSAAKAEIKRVFSEEANKILK